MALPCETPVSGSHRTVSWAPRHLVRAEFCSVRCFFMGLAVLVKRHVSLGVHLRWSGLRGKSSAMGLRCTEPDRSWGLV